MVEEKYINNVRQSIKELRVILYVMNQDETKWEEISGDIIDFPSFVIDSNSDLRRSCTLSFFPKDSTFDINQTLDDDDDGSEVLGGKFWMDKKIKIGIIEKTDYIESIYDMGYYLIGNPQKIYSPTENKITIQGIDLMAKLTGLRNGNLEGIPYIIPQGSDVRKVIISIIEEFGFHDYSIEEFPITVPNEIKVDIGSTAYDILCKLRDLLPNYEMFIGTDGYFVFRKIPNGEVNREEDSASSVSEEIVADDRIWDYVLLDYKKEVDYDNVKNSIEVIGKPHEVQRFFDDVDIQNNSYVVNLKSEDPYIPLNVGEKIGISSSKRLTTLKKYLSIYVGEELKAKYILYDENKERPIFQKENGYYVFKLGYEENIGSFWTIADRKELILTAKIKEDAFAIKDERAVEVSTYVFKTPKEGCEELQSPFFELNSNRKQIDAENLESNKKYTLTLNSAIDKWQITNTEDAEEDPPLAHVEDGMVVVEDETLTQDTIREILNDQYFIYNFKTETSDIKTLEGDINLRLSNMTSPNFSNFIITKGQIANIEQLENNKIYTVQFHRNRQIEEDEIFYLTYLGSDTPYAKVQEMKKSSPFYVNGTLGVINKVLSGGEYDNIYSDSLALQRAEWELYNYCRLNESVVINCVPLYWLDVNTIIEITLPNKYGTEKTELYIIKSINISGGSNPTQSITMVKYYPYDKSEENICYGFRIDSIEESDPKKKIVYIEDAIGKKPAFMDYEKEEFNYGDWEDAFFMPKPCMLTRTGEVDYYLNPYDYSKKLDGTDSDIYNENYEGNAMMEWGSDDRPIYMSIKHDTYNEQYYYVYIANYKKDDTFTCYPFYDNVGEETKHFYTAIYNGSVINDKLRSLSGKTVTQEELNVETIKANGGAYTLEQYSDRFLINMLLLLIGKSTNSQEVFGKGNCGGRILKTGTCDKKGLFYGSDGYSNAVKVFGMENYWGNALRTVWGDIVYTNHSSYPYSFTNAVKLTQSKADGSQTNNYYEIGSDGKPNVTDGFIDTGFRSLTFYRNNEYVKYMKISNLGFIAQGWQTNQFNKYYCDVQYQEDNIRKNGLFAQYGGEADLKEQNGMFFKKYDSKVYASSALSYKPFSYNTKVNITYVIGDTETVIEYNYGADCLNPDIEIPTVEGYQFKGWSLSPVGEVLEKLEAEEPTILYAIYEEKREKEPMQIEDFYLSGGFQETEVVKEIDTTGYKFITFTCNGVGTSWLMHPNIGGWAYLYAGFNQDLSYSANIQNRHYKGEDDNNEFDQTIWTSEDKTYTIDISSLNGMNQFRLWLHDSPNGKYYVTFSNVTLHN